MFYDPAGNLIELAHFKNSWADIIEA